MLYILDTDIQSLLEFDSPDARLLKDRLAHVPDGDIAGTIISCEERLRGWLAFLAQNRSLEQQIETYVYLQRLITSFQALRILPFDTSAATELRRLQAMKPRLSTMDLKIAAIALSNNATLVTRNLVHFGKIPGLRAEDWTR